MEHQALATAARGTPHQVDQAIQMAGYALALGSRRLRWWAQARPVGRVEQGANARAAATAAPAQGALQIARRDVHGACF
jgi:hypothetical protein